jgi:dynein heavy chain
LFSDAQIVKESMLEDINNILNSGDVPNLYPPDVMEQILQAVRPVAKAAGRPETRAGIFAEFVSLVREHLHIVLAMSPIGSAFRNRCRMFPALVNCCTIDWFSAWPQDALSSVARSFLADDAGGAGAAAAGAGAGAAAGASLQLGPLVEPLCGLAVAIHQGVEAASSRYLAEQRRYNYTTPTSYLELLRLYASKLNEQRSIVTGKLHRYRNGLTKLSETNDMVQGLQAKLRDLQPVLEKAQADTAALLARLEVDQREADVQATHAAKDEAECAEVARAVSVIKEECQRDLDEA